MSTGGDDAARPGTPDTPRTPEPASDTSAASAPWERPRRWPRARTETTRVEDLLARFSSTDSTLQPRRRRRAAEPHDDDIAAGDLIAALAPGLPMLAEPTAAQAPEPTAAQAPEPTAAQAPEPTTAQAPEPTTAQAPEPAPPEAVPPDTAPPAAPWQTRGTRDELPDGDDTLTTVIPVIALGHPEPPGTPSVPTPPPDASWESILATLHQQSSVDPPPPPDVPVTPAVAVTPAEAPEPAIDASEPTEPSEPAAADEPESSHGPTSPRDEDRPDAAGPAAGPAAVSASEADTPAAPRIQATVVRTTTGIGRTTAGSAARTADSPVTHADRLHRGWLVAGRTFVAVFAVLVLLAAGTDWVILARAASTLDDRSVTAVATDDTNISTPNAAPPTGIRSGTISTAALPVAGPAKTYQAENILLMGSDTRMSAADAQLGGSSAENTMQSDVLMVAHLSADRSHVTVVSIPRDLYVRAPTCKAWDYSTNSLSDKDYISPYTEWKITNAFSVGGPQCTVRAVQALTGLRIDRVIIIDFAGFQTMVDALGGITVTACRPIVDGQLGTILPSAGTQHINGTQALSLVRARKVAGDEESDLARIHRQQMVLSTMLRQATSAGVLLNPARLNSLLQAFVNNVWTDNVTLDDLLSIAQSLGNLDPATVTFYTVPTVANGTGLEETAQAQAIWSALRADEPLPGETLAKPTPSTTAPSTTSEESSAAPPSPITSVITQLVTSIPQAPQLVSVDPADVDLQVVNVAGRGGVATVAKNGLNRAGFHVTDPDLLLIPGDVRRTVTVEYSEGNRDAAVTVASAVPGATLVPIDGLGDRVRLMLGSDFDGTVQQVTVGDAVPAALATTPSPVVQTILSTVTTTPSAPTSAPPTTPTTSTPSSSTLSTLTSVESVNAAQADCF